MHLVLLLRIKTGCFRRQGYGKKGVYNWGLPPHAELLFTIEILKLQTEDEAWAAMREGEL